MTLVEKNFTAALLDYTKKRYFKGQEASGEWQLAKEWYAMYLSGGSGDCYSQKLISLIN